MSIRLRCLFEENKNSLILEGYFFYSLIKNIWNYEKLNKSWCQPMGFPSCSNLPEAEVGHLQATSLESRASIQHLIPGRDAFRNFRGIFIEHPKKKTDQIEKKRREGG